MAPVRHNEALSGKLAQLGLGPDGLLDQRYRIVRLLGEGGMGTVYLGEHVGLKRPVAVKVLHAEFANREDAIRRFEREAQVSATLRHPNIVEVFDVGVAKSGEPYLVMEYLEGEGLRDLMVRHPRVDFAAACAVLEPVLLALQAAHRKEIVHRDLKPDNVFLASQPGEPMVVKVIDFGISKIAGGDPDRWRTQTGMVLGTPNYMSPEQARGAAGVDHRTDLYAAGTILFEMLTGGLPYTGENFAEFFARLLTEPPRSPQSVYPELDPALGPLLLKAISKEPAARFQSAGEMLEALAAFPAFARRGERASLFGSSQALRTYAVGDLGAAMEAAESLTAKPTQAGSRTDMEDVEAELAEVPAKRSWPLFAALGLVVVLAATVVVLLLTRSAPPPAPAPTVVVPPPAPVAPVAAPVVPPPAAQPAPAPAEAERSAGSTKTGAKPARRKIAPAAPAEEPPAEAKSGSSSGLGDNLRALGSDLVKKARSQVKRIPDPRSK
jgi:eukaryotic-like serine/threonine-protein kinase